MTEDWLGDARSTNIDGLIPCAECGNRYKFIELKKFKIRGEQKLACKSCINKEKDRLKKEHPFVKPKDEATKQVQPAIAEKVTIDTTEILESQGKIVKMLEKLQESISTNHGNQPSVPEVGTLNLYLSPPSIESLFHLIRSSGKIVENDLSRSFGDYYAHVKYLVLEMRVRDYVWKDDHGWLMINPTMDIQSIKDLDPWFAYNDPGNVEAYLDGLKRKAMRFKFKPVSLLSIDEQARLLKDVLLINSDNEDDELLSMFDKMYEIILSMKPRLNRNNKEIVESLKRKIAYLKRIVDIVIMRNG